MRWKCPQRKAEPWRVTLVGTGVIEEDHDRWAFKTRQVTISAMMTFVLPMAMELVT